MKSEVEDIMSTDDDLKGQYHTILEHGKVVILTISETGQIEYASEYIEDILGFKPENVTGKSIYSFTDPGSIRQLKTLIAQSRQGENKPVNFQDFGLFCMSCNQHFFDGTMLPIDSSGERKLALYLHDVTERKLEADRLTEVNNELDSFIYKVSHDLRSPLLSISGLINLTEKTVPKESLEYITLMRRSVDRLNKFISQLTQYSRNNNTNVHLTAINFKELFNEVLETYRFLPESDKIDYQVEIEKEAITYSDHLRLKIVLNNIISNAIKYHDYTREHPFIKIVLNSNKKRFRIRISDNGTGIAPEKVGKIFDMFNRATDKAGGTGLGLYIVKKALEKLNATIAVESKLGEGTSFVIDVPNEIEFDG